MTKPRTLFGRHESCDCVLMHATVSREHFLIEHTNEKYFVVDRDSGNGTFLNGDRIRWAELKDGYRLQAGPFVLIAELGGEGKGAGGAENRAAGSSEARLEDDPAFTREHRTFYPREYLEGIRQFNAGRYFEAHEVWEEAWLRSSGQTKVFYQMLIQAAVGLHHRKRGNTRGARGMYEAVNDKLDRLPDLMMSLDLSDFGAQWRLFFSSDSDDGSFDAPPKTAPRVELLPLDF